MKHKYVPVCTPCTARLWAKKKPSLNRRVHWGGMLGGSEPPSLLPHRELWKKKIFVKNYPISSFWKNWAYALIVWTCFPLVNFLDPPLPHLLKHPILTYLTLHTGRSNTMPRWRISSCFYLLSFICYPSSSPLSKITLT